MTVGKAVCWGLFCWAYGMGCGLLQVSPMNWWEVLALMVANVLVVVAGLWLAQRLFPEDR